LFVSPYVAGLQAELLAKAREESDITGIYPGRFKVLDEADKDGESKTVYVERIAPDGSRMHNVFAELRRGDKEAVLVSALAYQRVEGPEARRYIVLEDGYRYVGRPGDGAYEVTHFATHALLFDTGSAQPAFRKQDAFPTMALIASDNRRHKAELQWRLSLPISVVVLAMLAIPLARTSPRQGKYSKLFTAFLIYFAYNNAVGVFQKFVERGDIPPAVGVWPVHIAMAALVAGLLAWQSAAPLRLRGAGRDFGRAA
jgi:lipopolysaccharide export system permease protein